MDGEGPGTLASQGVDGPATWQIWTGWFIPIYAWFGPFLTMKRLSSHVEDLRQVRARWWASFLFSSVMWVQSALFAGTILGVVGLTASAVSLGASYLALKQVIERTTASVAAA